MRIEPYLYFNGRCEEAVEFYRRSVGATLNVLTRFKDVPGSQAPAGAENKVLHADFKIGDTTILASDGECDGKPNFQGFSLAITAGKDAEADRLFEAFCDGGRIQVPLTATPFASRFGMVADRFGVLWTIVAYEQTTNV
ncbi:VOC family protein [Mesorhizobium amorphae]|uniref:VOC family protein n=1 Tax=Mesorhizobium amorphae TaxID=71433 RepID=UPI00118226F9|nr:VOC family protein [Mesorhizobium amorphae]